MARSERDKRKDRVVEAARRFLALIDNLTTDGFARGDERLEREDLRDALCAVDKPLKKEVRRG